MKYQVSSLDLHFLMQELSAKLKSAKIDKVFQPGTDDFLIAMHLPGEGKKILRVRLPNFVFLTDFKGEVPEEPPDFCMVLRKYLSGKRISNIKQVGFERIIELSLDSKEGPHKLIIELFSPGNMILADNENRIISVLHAKKFRDRTLRGNVVYTFPKDRPNPLGMPKQEFTRRIIDSEKESVVKSLALDLSLGGSYAEEICARAGVDKAKKKITEDEAGKVYRSFRLLLEEGLDPNALYKDGKPVAVLPFAFISMQGFERKGFGTFNNALDAALTVAGLEEDEEKKLLPHRRQLEKLKKQVEQQREQLAEFEKYADENQKKGELIYRHFSELDDILKSINKARGKYSFREIKEKLKGHSRVKDIDEKSKTVVVEL